MSNPNKNSDKFRVFSVVTSVVLSILAIIISFFKSFQ